MVAASAALLLAGALPAWPQGAAKKEGLVSINLAPKHVRRSTGDKQYLTATAGFSDGTHRNVTQRVEYRSSNPKVAAATNPRGERSRIDLLTPGKATISAVDPLTGVTSTATGGDVTVHVVGALERITMKPTEVRRAVGEFQHFTVTGHYPGGEIRNLTQNSRYISSDPLVARATNLRGDKSRVEAVAPGTVTISAVHSASGLTTEASGTNATFTVLGPLEKITLSPPHPRRALGAPQHYTATGHYAGGAVRNLTQKVEYTTSDPAVATAPNADGNRSRIETVGLGTVTISARDPVTGISSGDADGDVQLTVYDPKAPKPKREAAPTGERPPLRVCGDASGDGALGPSDPLWILAGTVGVAACPPAACDVDADGAVGLRDALNVGWVVAGYDVVLRCPRSAAN